MFDYESGAPTTVGMLRQQARKSLSVGATTDNVPEGMINFYFTTARSRGVLSAISPIAYDDASGVISFVGLSQQSVKIKSVDYTLTNSDKGVVASSDATITLPAHVNGLEFFIKKSDNTGTITISASSGSIDGLGSVEITSQYESITVISDGSNWHII